MKIKRWLPFAVAILLSSCGKNPTLTRSQAPLFLLAQVAFPNLSLSVQTKVRPILLVPGWGYKITHVAGKGVYDPYIQWLTEEGFPPEHIYVLDYSYLKNLDRIREELGAQFHEIMDAYPADTQFDVMGHSLGGFTGLYGFVEAGLAPRVKKFVSLSGIPQGWDSWYCATGICGKAHPDLIPYHSPFVMDFLKAHAEEIHALDKCSLYSPADEFVRPYWAGRFEDGTNVEVPNMKHMQTIWKKSSFLRMREACYGIVSGSAR